MQKKVLLAIAIVACGLASHAQVQKGDWLLGGSFSYSTNSNTSPGISGNTTNTSSNSNFNPGFGLAVGKNSVIGLRGSFGYTPGNNGQGVKQFNINYLAGGFWKKYFPINEKVGWFTDFEAAYSFYENKSTNATDPTQNYKYTDKGFSVLVSPGIYYKAASKILLDAGFGNISYNYTSPGGGSGQNNFKLNLLNYYTFGISFLISSRS